jgi:hypothetical protein
MIAIEVRAHAHGRLEKCSASEHQATSSALQKNPITTAIRRNRYQRPAEIKRSKRVVLDFMRGDEERRLTSRATACFTSLPASSGGGLIISSEHQADSQNESPRQQRKPMVTRLRSLQIYILAISFPITAAFAVVPQDAIQWQVTEISFEGKESYAGQPNGVRLEAVFRGPDGSNFIVPGFWDGGRSWKIRFAPTMPGEWSYETRAIEENARVVETLHSGKVLRGGEVGEKIGVAVVGFEEIELVVRDAGDGSEYDHADWGEARFVKQDGSAVQLDSLTPLQATQGHGTLTKGTNLFGKPLTIGGRAFSHGLGSHSPGRIRYRLAGGEVKLLATVGVDSQVGKHGSVRFEVLATRSNQADVGRRDPGLHGQAGRFQVRPAAGDNPLYRHGGFLRVSGDGHSLTYTDGTPFFWLGDTWWFCPSDLVPIDGSTNPQIPSAYHHLLNVRKSQG